ncbi:MAG: hypothetical protein ABI831_25045, partial [Betaproteobacteria bacterium]
MPMPLLVSAPIRPPRLGAVPRARLRQVGAFEKRSGLIVDLGLRDPVARVRWVSVAAIAVVGDGHVADHVVARQQIAAGGDPLQVRMVEAHTRIEYGHDDAGVSRREIPSGLDVRRRLHLPCRRTQIPLPRR